VITGHGGNIFEAARKCECEPGEILDMSSNMNPLGPPPPLLDHLGRNLDVLARLPEADARQAGEALSHSFGLDPPTLLLGSGTTQFIYAAPAALHIQRALIPVPTYADYADACRMSGAGYETGTLPEENDFDFQIEAWRASFDQCDTVYLCNPNNPTGRLIPATLLEELCRSYPRTRFIIDESYLPLCPGGEPESMLHRPWANRIVLRSLSKIYCIPGLRIGFLVGDPQTVQRFSEKLPPWSVNSLAQCMVEYVSEHRSEMQHFAGQTLQYLSEEKAAFLRELQRRTALIPVPSATVFVLARLPASWTAATLKNRLLESRILIRDCSNFQGLDRRYVRLKDRQANRELIERLAACCPATGNRKLTEWGR